MLGRSVEVDHEIGFRARRARHARDADGIFPAEDLANPTHFLHPVRGPTSQGGRLAGRDEHGGRVGFAYVRLFVRIHHHHLVSSRGAVLGFEHEVGGFHVEHHVRVRHHHRESIAFASHHEPVPPIVLRAALQALDAHVAPHLHRGGGGSRTLSRHDDRGEAEVTMNRSDRVSGNVRETKTNEKAPCVFFLKPHLEIKTLPPLFSPCLLFARTSTISKTLARVPEELLRLVPEVGLQHALHGVHDPVHAQ
mmetsp:Transcript_4248/g.16922  ORF Transcript_4248/g.16922 Transcript_4248/m.16922 type:complete len:250 (+) Transcript_4248:311-1060(+)